MSCEEIISTQFAQYLCFVVWAVLQSFFQFQKHRVLWNGEWYM